MTHKDNDREEVGDDTGLTESSRLVRGAGLSSPNTSR